MYSYHADGRCNRGGSQRFDIGAALLGASTNVPGGEAEGTMIKFDLRPDGVSVVPPGHVIKSAQFRLRSISSGPYYLRMDVVAYPLSADWQEGTGGSGGTGFPYTPTSTNDATYAYRNVTDVDTATNVYYYGGVSVTELQWSSWKNTTNLIAKTGDAWAVPGGRGIGTDLLDRKMIDERWTKVGWPSSSGLAVGAYFPSMSFTAEGVKVLNEWSKGTLANNGFNIWGRCPSDDARCGGPSRTASRESAYKPELVLVTGPDPRMTLLMVR